MSCFKGVLLWLFPAVALAGTLEAQKDKVEVYSSADRKSSVVATLGKGDTLESGERSGMYWPVKTKNGKTGFVSVLMVKAKIEANSSLNDAMRDAVKKGRSSAAADGGRSRTAVMGVRGLDDTSDTGMAGSLRPNTHAVFAMEDFEIPKGRIELQSELVAREIENRMKQN